MNSNYDEWDQIYRRYPMESWGWELGKPRPILVEFVEKGLIKKARRWIFIAVLEPTRFT